MQKLNKKFMFIALLIFFIELLCIVGLVFVSKILPNWEFSEDVIIISLCVVVIIDLLYISIVLSNISNARKKNDITAVEIIGEGVEEIYNFGQIGVIIVDDYNNVIWTNDWFEDIQTRLVDHNIYSWKRELLALQDKKIKKINVDIDNRVYEVKFVKEANLFIFKDITEYEAISHFQKEHAPVVGFISIDNYQDVISIIDESKSSDLFSNIQRIIFDYFKKYVVLIRKIRSDAYSLIATKGQYDRLIEDNFSLLDEIRNVSKEEDFE